MEKEYYNINEVMEQLGRSRATVYAYIKSGLLKAHKLSEGVRGRYIITREDLRAFVEGPGVPEGYYQNLYPRPHKGDEVKNG